MPYYIFTYGIRSGPGNYLMGNKLSADKHPMMCVLELEEFIGSEVTLWFYKEISESEYKMLHPIVYKEDYPKSKNGIPF